MRISLAALLAFAVALPHCKMHDDPAPAPSARPRFVPASDGDVATIVRDAIAKAGGEKKRLLVYVGASWCEPCREFHQAAERGELDSSLPDVTFAEFDLDRDEDRLAAAGYRSRYIPLFALPNADGRASGKQTAGGIKGGDNVAYLTPRVKALLGR